MAYRAGVSSRTMKSTPPFRQHRTGAPHLVAALTLAMLLTAACSDRRHEAAPEAARGRSTGNAAAGTQRSTSGAEPSGTAVQERPFKKGEIPAGCRFVGDVIGGARWTDANGENVLIVTQRFTSPRDPDASEDAQRQEIRAYTYTLADTGTALLWKIEDGADNWCDKGEGLIGDVVVTDIDGDGIAENAFAYNVEGSCDVSPILCKLMLHSGSTKYAVRGTRRVDVGGGQKMGGEKTFDPAFNNAPPAFRTFAETMWKKVMSDG